jgi:hypothetical protein
MDREEEEKQTPTYAVLLYLEPAAGQPRRLPWAGGSEFLVRWEGLLLAVVGVIVVAAVVGGVGGSCRGSSDGSAVCVRLYMCQRLWECPSSGHSRGALVEVTQGFGKQRSRHGQSLEGSGPCWRLTAKVASSG